MIKPFFVIFKLWIISVLFLLTNCTKDEIIMRDYSDTTHITLYKQVNDTTRYIRYHHLVDTSFITDTIIVTDTVIIYDTIH